MLSLIRMTIILAALMVPHSPLRADPPSIQPRALTPEALAKHLGVHHSSFEMSFAEGTDEVVASICIYERGKKTHEREAIPVPLTSPRNQKCHVMFSHREGDGRLLLTVATPVVTRTDVIDFSLDPPMTYPRTVIDSKGRIILAAKPAKIGDLRPAIDDTVKALVIEFREK